MRNILEQIYNFSKPMQLRGVAYDVSTQEVLLTGGQREISVHTETSQQQRQCEQQLLQV